MTRSRRVAARASRSALIDASVPELTRRTISIDGTASTISAASSTSRLGRRAEGRPAIGRVVHRRERLRVGVAEESGPHDCTQST